MSETQSIVAESADARRTMSRRALFSSAAAFAAFWGESARRAYARPDPPEVSADVDPGALLVKLVRRATFGFSEAELALAVSLGYQGYLEYQLDHTAIDDSALNLRLDL